MRGKSDKQVSMLMLIKPEQRKTKKPPIRKIKKTVDEILDKMAGLFDEMYGRVGRPSIPPERLLKASLLMARYTVRSERAFCEQLEYAVSQRKRKRVEEIFGWIKTVGGFARTRYRGIERTQLWAYLVGTAYNLLRMARMESAVA